MFVLVFLISLSLDPIKGKMEEMDLSNQDASTENWTSCEEFLNGSSFSVDDVIDEDWVIFYYWSMHSETSYHVRFSPPSPMLVDRFRLELNNHIQPPVNWSQADLFLETSIDLSGLFIRTDLPGKFRFVPSFSFHFHFSPYLEVAMKVLDSYLGMMNCKQKLGYALAKVQNMPNPQEIEKIAGKFGFQNPFGRSYLTKNPYEPPAEAFHTTADDDDDDQIEWNAPSLSRGLMI